MTISTTENKVSYNGNGVTTVFAFPYLFFANSDLLVYSVDSLGALTLLTLTTDYTVTGANDEGGGTVTTLVAPATGRQLLIVRQLSLTQETDYIEGDPFPAESHERALDRLTMITQQIQEQADRALSLPVQSSGVSTELPAPVANAFIGWNSAADGFQNNTGVADAPVSVAMAPVVAAETLADGRTAFGATLVGDSVFTAVSAAAARSALSAAGSGAVGSSGLTMATGRLLGRTTASSGAIEEISVGGGLALAGSVIAAAIRGYIDGLTMSTAGSSTTMTIGAGQATDSTNAVTMSLVASISKTTSAWAVGTGNGGLDTGSIANSTWYYFYLIRRPDTGVVDVIFSLNSTSPALPTNYTQFRYIGAGLTNGSGQWVAFRQVGDEFYWSTPVQDFNGAGSATASLLTISVPRGRKVKGYFNLWVSANSNGIYVSDPDNADVAPQNSAVSPFSTFGFGSASFSGSIAAQCWTNTSAQIRRREINTGTVGVATLGWTDLRGRNA